MPLKKKKGKKGYSKNSDASSSKSEGLENVDPNTLVSEMGKGSKPGSGKKKKRKGKKKKISKSEKDFEKLEKATEKLQENKALYHRLVNTLDIWLTQHAAQAMEMFKTFDIEGEGVITFEEFKSGMFDMNAPVSQVELHLLAKLLDPENSGEIDYTELPKGLQYAKEVIELEKDTELEESSLILTERNVPRCKHCKLGLWGPYEEKNPVFVLLEMKLLSFESFKEHPGHFTLLVHTHIPVIGLIDLIKEQTGIVTSKLTIFKDRSRSMEALLPLDSTLEECDIEGEVEEEPEQVTLFYDYATEINDCPLLLCDHYFSDASKKKIST